MYIILKSWLAYQDAYKCSVVSLICTESSVLHLRTCARSNQNSSQGDHHGLPRFPALARGRGRTERSVIWLTSIQRCFLEPHHWPLYELSITWIDNLLADLGHDVLRPPISRPSLLQFLEDNSKVGNYYQSQ